jgi:hypothetical protein
MSETDLSRLPFRAFGHSATLQPEYLDGVQGAMLATELIVARFDRVYSFGVRRSGTSEVLGESPPNDLRHCYPVGIGAFDCLVPQCRVKSY